MKDNPTYCLDTSAFTSAYHVIYRASQFISLWDRMSGLVDQGRSRIRIAVYDELKRQDDALFRWVRDRSHMTMGKSTGQLRYQLQIAKDFPALAKQHSTAKPGDPWVIALAMENNYIVVSNEKTGSKQNPKIPHICRTYNIPHWTVTDIVHHEGWVFR